IRCVCGKKIGPDPRNFNQRVCLGRNDLLIRTFPKYPDWSKRDDIKAKLKVELILLLHKHKFPPVANDDVYMGVLAQAENFKEHHMSSLN
ncbi:DUF3387 domain-containing protein, partial [Escherichia coli]|nr:DUF3387 domain-containing protein [Escherichia coli]